MILFSLRYILLPSLSVCHNSWTSDFEILVLYVSKGKVDNNLYRGFLAIPIAAEPL